MEWIKRKFDLTDSQTKSVLNHFVVTDYFNPENEIEGYICRCADYRYGALAITRVNEEETEQIIWGTPKLKYPFDKNGNFYDINPIRVFSYEKIDGTNILSYWYSYNGSIYNTFKTRMTPVVSKNTFGDFKEMWETAIGETPWISKLISMNKEYNLSFELYGWRNPLTVSYKVPLDVALLFGVNRHNHSIVPPNELTSYKKAKIPNLFKFNPENDFIKEYKKAQSEQSQINSSCKEDEYFSEGVVIYSQHSNGEWKQYKCKPEEIQKLHWSNAAIPFQSIYTTVINLFETYDSPTYNNLKEWLLEDYTEEQIDMSRKRIIEALQKGYDHMEFVSKINYACSLAQEKGLDVAKDKAETMRFFSQYFDKKDMRKVGSYLLRKSGLI